MARLASSTRLYRVFPLVLFAFVVATSAQPVASTQWYVVAGGTGSGSSTAPFGRIQDAINAAQPGDEIIVGPGTFTETLQTIRAGAASQPITIRSANGRGTTIVTALGRVLTVAHPYITIDGLVLDGQYGANDLVRLGAAASNFTLRNTEVRRSGNDAIDMNSVQDVLIENSLIHHALNPTGGRTDAHGITGAAVQRLTIRNTEIHTFSGDGVQVDPGRTAPGWNDVTIEGCRIWLAPLTTAENGFPVGSVTGENAVDTKASASFPRSRITIRDVEMYGFKWPTPGNNIAAFNLKENVDATVDRVTVYDSEIAFRLRGPAVVRVQNAVVHNVDVGVRYEDSIQNLRIWNTTFGTGVQTPFVAASASSSGLDVRNLLLLGSSLPAEAQGASNLAVSAAGFVNASAHNYQLAPGSPALNTGVAIPEVSTDRLGVTRPQGSGYDVGAYEQTTGGSGVAPRAPTNLRIIIR
jgi:Right handed beta helix region